MIIYRAAKTEKRARDLSGTGAYNYGGRWNSKGTYILYTSENSSLAYLETLVHQEESELMPQFFMVKISVDDTAELHTVPDQEYPPDWQKLENIRNKLLGDTWMHERKYIGLKVRSAINPAEYNYLLNPLFPGYHDRVSIVSATLLDVDKRLIKR